MSQHARIQTGIDGLDLILDGGLRYPAEGSVFLVILGGPGTGKTHLALELTVRILAHAEGAGASHLLYGLDQTPEEIHAKLGEDFGYFGVAGQWSRVTGTIRSDEYRALLHEIRTDGDRATPRYLLSASLRAQNPTTIKDSAQLFARLDADIRHITEATTPVGRPLVPRLVTIDNISLSAFDSGEEVRGTLRTIRDHLASRRMHGIFAVETPGDGASRATFAAAEYAADVIIQLGYHSFGDQFKERSIEIAKARHQFYFRGTHHFSIAGKSGTNLRGARGQRPPGIHVYPSIPTLLSHLQYGQRKVAPGSAPVDFGSSLTVRPASSNGLIGPPDLAAVLCWSTFEFLSRGDGVGLLVSFQQNAEEALDRAARWFPDREIARRIKVLSFEPEYMSSGKFLKDVYDVIEGLRAAGDAVERAAIVGLEHLRWGFPLLHDAKMLIPWLTVFFKFQAITSLFVETTSRGLGEGGFPGDSPIAATVDNLFTAQSREPRGAVLHVTRSLNARGGATVPLPVVDPFPDSEA